MRFGLKITRIRGDLLIPPNMARLVKVASAKADRLIQTDPLPKKGTVFRHVLDVLRDAEGQMTARQIVEVMLRAKGAANPDTKEVRRLAASVQTCLQSHNVRTVRTIGEGIPGRRIVSPANGAAVKGRSL
jgi:hypothetical protein